MPRAVEDLGVDVVKTFGLGVYHDVASERYRAAQKHSNGSIELASADDPRWWHVVVEELGEVARAFQESPERLHEELVQLAAMATAWAASAKEEITV